MALLHAIHLGPRTIWIVLAGQTVNDERGVLGGDTGLSSAGRKYSKAVVDFIVRRELSQELRDKGCVPRRALARPAAEPASPLPSPLPPPGWCGAELSARACAGARGTLW
jgi:6-phosphofructo-2-kinase